MSPPTPRQIAEAEQRAVSNPAISAFVSASAGSGKTKLLTDRLLRLMLSGADPARIQCLTFTKAGAAEMSLRLQARLGKWVTADDIVLDAELAALEIPPDAPARDAARKLFATVLDLPGGMRISTIHAFCQSLLRRFPLEAALSPHFELLDDANAMAMQRTAREAMIIAATDPSQQEAIRSIAAQLSLDDFSALVDRLQERRDRLDAALAHGQDELEAAQRRVLGVTSENPDDIVAQGVAGIDHPLLAGALTRVARDGSKALAAKALSKLDWLALPPNVQADNWPDWTSFFFATAARSPRSLVNDVLAAKQPDLLPVLLAEQERIAGVMDRLRAIEVARLSADLVRLALPSIRSYDNSKQASGWLDYADLIGRTNALLRDPGAAWVLYKLDGGLDHLLLDEVQDTAPDQWRIADALTAEFFAGAGARETHLPRSFFAVGDHKQSIFSFQGADPSGFDYWRERLERRVRDGGAEWKDGTLHVSFRSTTPVLALVDEVFRDPRAAMNRAGSGTSHFADRADHAGRVEIWPLTPRVIPPPSEPWEAATEYRGQTSAPQVLANALAEWIAVQTDGTVDLPSRGRKLHAGDILVLVRTRGAFDRALLRALKARGVPVAGLDRMVLTDQPAVADLLALCDTLLLPQDELSLACVLTSPLGGLSDDSLMALCMGRQQGLWDTLRRRAPERPDWAAAHDFLATLFSRVDYVTPHALLTEALGRLGGRARLFARLGPQAAEAIDELLSTALSYASRNAPSLQAFLHWLRQSGSVVKREAEGAARELRIMTVHGAKGLQAPMVILPDTTSRPGEKGTLIWAKDPLHGMQVPLWSPRKETHDTNILQARQATTDLEREEYNRLLYVALTRAEDRLVICGWEPSKPKPECWYELVRDAFGRLQSHQTEPFAAIARPWDGDLLSYATEQKAPIEVKGAQPREMPEPPPAWLGQHRNWQPTPPPAEPALPVALAPSRPQDSDKGPVPQAASPLALRDAAGKRFRRGQLLHSLLQHLPNQPPALRRDAARAYLARPGTGITPQDAADLTEELMALIDDPALAPLFGPGSRAEIPLTGVVQTPAGPTVIGGLVDRLVELPTEILVADYKTNRDPPPTEVETPVLYLRQMAAYRRLLRDIFPTHTVRCALIWTRAARADWLSDTLLDTCDPAGHASGAQPPRSG